MYISSKNNAVSSSCSNGGNENIIKQKQKIIGPILFYLFGLFASCLILVEVEKKPASHPEIKPIIPNTPTTATDQTQEDVPLITVPNIENKGFSTKPTFKKKAKKSNLKSEYFVENPSKTEDQSPLGVLEPISKH